MPIHILKMIDAYDVAKNTKVFVFEKPNQFQFIPGQYGGFTLINPKETDLSGITRRFSILSSPDDDFLAIVTRQQNSAFKRELFNFSKDSEIKFAGPTGNFTLHAERQIPAVMIAGGIGIAPFYSMLHYANRHLRDQQLYLFYGNRTFADAAFMDELSKLQHENPNFKFVPTFDDPETNWPGERGFVTHTMLKKYVPDLYSAFYYVCGSPKMVTNIQELLIEMEIPETQIRVEDFPGY